MSLCLFCIRLLCRERRTAFSENVTLGTRGTIRSHDSPPPVTTHSGWLHTTTWAEGKVLLLNVYIHFIYAHLHEYSVMGGILHVFLLLFFIVYHYGSRHAPNCYSPCNISYIQKNRLPLFPFPSISSLLLPPLVIIAWTISPAVIRVKGSREVIEGTESEGGDISSVNELKTALMHCSVWQI